jgi:TPR repeat protein
MNMKVWIALIILFQISGCAITQGGKGFDLIDENEYAKALPFFEAAANQDSDKTAAIMASFLYLSDYQIPRDIDKSKEYFELAKKLESGPWQQYLDYFIPLAEARIMLYDDDPDNDSQGTDILRGDRYSEYSSPLGLLAKAYAFGKGVNKNLKISKLLFERALEHDRYVYSAHHYAWFLATHPDESFRDGYLASKLIKRVLENDEEAERAATLDTLAAIHAENGEFEAAISVQKKAIDTLAEESKEYPQFLVWNSWLQCRLKKYELNQPWHYQSGQMPFIGATGSQPCIWE